MTVYYNYEAEKKLHIPWMNIIGDVITGTLEYMKYKKEAEVSVSVVDADEIKRLNKEFRGINKVTDVLSFPIGDKNPETGEMVLGDIVLCADKVIAQAEEFGHTRKRELAFLTCHSMLHLLGYDHMNEKDKKKMRAKEEKIMSIYTLIKQAKEAQKMAYAPFSKFKVGAALLCKDGSVFTGCNIENSSYGATICAERTAMVKAISEGHKDFVALAVTEWPCGICRQFMYEFNPNLMVYCKGEVKSLKELLPEGFRLK